MKSVLIGADIIQTSEGYKLLEINTDTDLYTSDLPYLELDPLFDYLTQNSFTKLNFFSVDTSTIYPPCLEIRWDDSSYISGSLQEITDNQSIIHVSNNPGIFKSTVDNFQFRISARDQYPTRRFQTTSLYLDNKALPSSSYWSIKDLDTEEIVVDYDVSYTKISCDSSGNYFDVYMNGLEPERYYKILIKIVLNSGEILEIDNNSVFKIVK